MLHDYGRPRMNRKKQRAVRRNKLSLYHGSQQELEELHADDPGYKGSLGWGLYLTTDAYFAAHFGDYIHEVESPVPDELVAYIEPNRYDCGNDLTFYTPGSVPFTFEVADRGTGEIRRYSILEDCEDEVKRTLRADLFGSAPLPSDIQEEVRSQSPNVRAVLGDMLSDAIAEIAAGDRIDDVVEQLVQQESEDNGRLSEDELSALERLLSAALEQIDSDTDEMVERALGTEISLDELSQVVREHGYSAFFIEGYAPGDEYVIVDEDYLPVAPSRVFRAGYRAGRRADIRGAR